MPRNYRRFDDDPAPIRRSGSGVGTLLFAAALGVSIGMLAAPETGVKTRRRLRRRLDEGLEGVQELGGRTRDRVRERLAAMRRHDEDLDEDLVEEVEVEDEGSTALGTLLALAAGAAATYFLSSERAAPARERVRETAQTVRRRATDRWERYQQSRDNGLGESGTTPGETAGGVSASDEPPLGS